VIRIAVDARCLNRSHLRGMGKYLQKVVEYGARSGEVAWTLFADRPDLPFHAPEVGDLEVDVFDWKGYRFHSWEQAALPWHTSRCGASVLLCPATTLPWWQPVPTVVTLHDVLPWNEREAGRPYGFYLGRLLPLAYRKCAAVITVSECSRRDILALWPDFHEKLYVVPHGMADRYQQQSARTPNDPLRAIGIRRPYLLYVGGELPRKRLAWAIRILEALADARVNLVVCGLEEASHDRIRETIPHDIRPQVLLAPFISETDMPCLYRDAAAVLYPTLYEGFGLPALEAQAVGTPVLFSALGSLAELCGPGAIVLPPWDLGAWVDACTRLVVRRGEDPSPDEASRRWARQYSWDECAKRHLDIFRRVATDREPVGITKGLQCVSPGPGQQLS
jgi:glycosyltransferase involved in cell wall biosynthesis